jgi:hypothetical protein
MTSTTAANQFRRKSGEPCVLALRRSNLDLDIFAREIAKLAECLAKRPQRFRATDKKDADAPHALGLLRARCQRPRRCRAAEQGDEAATSHVEQGIFPSHLLGPIISAGGCRGAVSLPHLQRAGGRIGRSLGQT